MLKLFKQLFFIFVFVTHLCVQITIFRKILLISSLSDPSQPCLLTKRLKLKWHIRYLRKFRDHKVTLVSLRIIGAIQSRVLLRENGLLSMGEVHTIAFIPWLRTDSFSPLIILSIFIHAIQSHLIKSKISYICHVDTGFLYLFAFFLAVACLLA